MLEVFVTCDFNFLEMHNTSVFLSIRKTAYQPLNQTKTSKTEFPFILQFSNITAMQFLFVKKLSPNKRSFKVPGGVGKGLDLRCRAKICVRELASVVSRGLPWYSVVSRCMLLTLFPKQA